MYGASNFLTSKIRTILASISGYKKDGSYFMNKNRLFQLLFLAIFLRMLRSKKAYTDYLQSM